MSKGDLDHKIQSLQLPNWNLNSGDGTTESEKQSKALKKKEEDDTAGGGVRI